MIQDILNIKEQLLNLKRGNAFRIDAWLFDGHRVYDIKIGAKWVYIKATHSHSPRKKISKNKVFHNFLQLFNSRNFAICHSNSSKELSFKSSKMWSITATK